jgi:hypothetical protein
VVADVQLSHLSKDVEMPNAYCIAQHAPIHIQNADANAHIAPDLETEEVPIAESFETGGKDGDKRKHKEPQLPPHRHRITPAASAAVVKRPLR